ncbi:MAG: WD40 repeat domain-containing protein, partial [Planctomycetota bacterium]
SVGFRSEGREVVSFSLDGTVKIWIATAQNKAPVLRGHRDRVTALAFGPGGTLLASASRDGSARVWDVNSHREVRPMIGDCAPFLALATAAQGSRLLGLTADGKLRFWGLPECALLPRQLTARMVAAAGRRFAIVSAAHDIEVWHLQGDRPVAAWKPAAPPRSLAISGSGDRVAWGCADGRVVLRDTRKPGAVAESKIHPAAAVIALDFAPDGRTLAAGARDGASRILDARTLEVRARLDAHADEVRGVSFSPDGTRLATCSSDGVRLWDPVTGHQVLLLPTEDQPAQAVAWSPDGVRLAAACGSYEVPGVIFLWEAD